MDRDHLLVMKSSRVITLKQMGFFQQHNSEETVEEHRKKNPEKGSDKI